MMTAISLWQPWASLLVSGVKVHETRSWAPPAKRIGERVVIHAAKRKWARDELSPDLHALCEATFGHLTLPFGAAIAHGVLTSAGPMWNEEHAIFGFKPETKEDALCGNWSKGRFAWRFADMIALTPPIPMRGRQSFFPSGINHHAPEITP